MGAEQYLRNAFNDFHYVDPSSLADGSDDKTLTREPHNFSRVFSGAWYECFCELFKNDKNKDKIMAVKQSCDAMIIALLDGILIAPSQLHFLSGVALAMSHCPQR